MSNKPLLKKTINLYSRSANEPDLLIGQKLGGKYLETKDVVEALKKYKNAKFNEKSNMLCNMLCFNCKSEDIHFYDEINNKDYCFDCWFKECFGELPK